MIDTLYTWRSKALRVDIVKSLFCNGGLPGLTAAEGRVMSNQGPKKKILKLSSETLARLTPGELQGAVGGITGVTDGASNQTGFDTNGAKLSVQWYLQKFTLRCR